MPQDRAVKFAGIAGLLFFVTQVVAVLLPGQPPDADASGAEIRKFFVDNRTGNLAGGVLQAIAIVFFVWFIVHVRLLISPRDGDDHGLGTAMLLGAVIGGALASASIAITASMEWVDGFAKSASEDVLLFGWYAAYLLFIVGTGAFVVIYGSFALALQRSGAGPTWLKWIAVVGVVANLFGMIAAVSASAAMLAFGAFLVFPIWVLATSITMLTGKLGLPSSA